MSIDPVPSEVSAFLVADVRSLLSLELLLLLYANRGRAWDVAELAKELRLDADWAREEINRFRALDLAAPAPHSPVQVRCGPLRPDAERSLAWLAGAYPSRRFSIIQCIYAAPAAPQSPADPATQIRSFADAFKLRKESDRG